MLLAKFLKNLAGQCYGINENFANFYPDLGMGSKGNFRGPRAPHFGHPLPFGQSQSDCDVFRLRLAALRGFLCGNADDVIKMMLKSN
jgi:hypothetical protein